MTLQEALLTWYAQVKRSLPWRNERDPYRILVSEILLQQTQVQVAIPYYHRFLERFPSLEALAQAPFEDVLKVWQGAGYYSRARRLHALAQQISSFPKEAAELRKLPGLGPYTAAALASIAFGEAVAAVDGNVRRVLARLQAWEKPRPQELQNLAQGLLDPRDPGTWNQALMELGALLCRPRAPLCPSCPLRSWCRGQDHPERYPLPRSRSFRTQPLVALVLQGPSGIYLEPHPGPLLAGLWGVPLDEALPPLLRRFGLREARLLGQLLHRLTHLELRVTIYWAPWADGESPEGRPLSRLDEKILKRAGVLATRPSTPPSDEAGDLGGRSGKARALRQEPARSGSSPPALARQ
jgi:A/G-specific adenine glycosylase